VANEEQAKLSIIIPTLNDEAYLPLLLGSIENQGLNGRCEIVVTDGGSQDKTSQIARDYGCRVVSGGLPAKGRNQGAEAATGELLLFLDTEALLPDGFLAKLLVEFQERGLDVASCGLEPIEEEWMPRFICPKFFYDLLYNWPAQLLGKAFPYASCLILVKREVHARLEGFDERIKIAEDHDYARRAARIGRFGLLRSAKLPLFMRRCRENGIIKTNLKYLVCNLFNISLGEVRSDVFRYDFGQCRRYDFGQCRTGASDRANGPNKPGFVLQFVWTLAYYVASALGVIGWLVFLLVLAPKLMSPRVRALLSRSDESELPDADRACAVPGRVTSRRAGLQPLEVAGVDGEAESCFDPEGCVDVQPLK
jgi:glycosyltransferase involved in cell wall biosynthesis